MFLNKTLESLSSCVHFESRCQFWIELPISLPQFMIKLRNQCPSLKTLILANIHFQKNLTGSYGDHVTERRLLLKGEVHEANILRKTSDEDVQLSNALFPELKVLSLNGVVFNPLCFYSYFSGLFLPKITVLNLSHQVCLPDIKVCFFATFYNLEELYLGGWNLTHPNRLIFLKYLKKLRVLDLENCLLSNDTISVLIQNSRSLEELYLCFTNIKDILRTNAETEFFPCLQSLCVRSSCVTKETIREFLTSCPSLKFVNVSGGLCRITETSDLYQEFKEKCFFITCKTVGFCNHFLKRKGCCK